jgi:hypothetical protein
MRYLPKDTRTTKEIWDSVPWFEKIAGIVFFSIPLLPIPLGILHFLGLIH